MLALLNLAVCSVGSRTRCCISRMILGPQQHDSGPGNHFSQLTHTALASHNEAYVGISTTPRPCKAPCFEPLTMVPFLVQCARLRAYIHRLPDIMARAANEDQRSYTSAAFRKTAVYSLHTNFIDTRCLYSRKNMLRFPLKISCRGRSMSRNSIMRHLYDHICKANAT